MDSGEDQSAESILDIYRVRVWVIKKGGHNFWHAGDARNLFLLA